MQKKHILAVQAVALDLLEAIAIGGEMGAPGGHLYAPLMGKLSLSQFQQIVGQMQGRGFIEQHGDCYTITESGKAFTAKLKASVEKVLAEVEAEQANQAVPA